MSVCLICGSLFFASVFLSVETQARGAGSEKHHEFLKFECISITVAVFSSPTEGVFCCNGSFGAA